MAQIYLSSTYSDLKECREAIYHALRRMRHDVIAMEDYVAADQRPLDQCLADVAACDIYVGIFAWRYGFIPDKNNPKQKSITELEYRHAVKTGKRRLIFLIDEDTGWPEERIEQGAGSARLKALREELANDYVVSFFRNCEELATQVVTAVANLNLRLEESRRISIGRLPVTGPDLFGRDKELELLDNAWADLHTNIITFVAWGGVGKSALVNRWLRRMAQDHYRGAERVYAWSFYSQGASDRAASADLFIDAALRWFGDTDSTQGSPWDKGERLAALIRRTRTLLLLDGLEPLQHPPNRAGVQEGRLKDPALQACLRELAAHQTGLCVITTREQISDLGDYENYSVVRKDLDHLSPQAGAQILRAQGVAGDHDELERASAEFGGHSLALTLLGSYLKDVCDGDIRRRDEIGSLEEDVQHGGHARRVMASYEKWLGNGPELAVLRMLGVFDRPAESLAIAALRAAPPIPGLTDALFVSKNRKGWRALFRAKTFEPLSDAEWNRTLAKLCRIKLLADNATQTSSVLDTHPLVREHFGTQLKEHFPASWREANNRLYKHLTRTAKELPDTMEEMTPLFAAVAHGCEAGKHLEAYRDVYRRRILRGEESFSINKLGAVGDDLATLTGFFVTPWQQPVARLMAKSQAFILNAAGQRLKALGRLREAAQPMQASLAIVIHREDWRNAAASARNLSQLYLSIGDLPQAIAFAQQSVGLASQSGNIFELMVERVALADALHQSGRRLEAEAAFREAEALQREDNPSYTQLYSLQGFLYCDLLLDQGQFQDVQTRASQSLKDGESLDSLLSNALDQLALGRALLLKAQQAGTAAPTKAGYYLHRAVDGLRQAGRQDFLPRGLLARAELHRLTSDYARAQADLAEAQRIVEGGEMGLHLADVHLEWARLHLAQGDPASREQARAHWAKAKEMIARMGYHRRDKDVAEIARELGEPV